MKLSRVTTIREAILSDAAAIAALTTELGYVGDKTVTLDRLERILPRKDQRVIVAMVDGLVAGWAHAQASEALESGFRVELIGLVVGARFRRRGIGRALTAAVEQWAAELGSAAVIVRSNVQRTESHHFYPALGYATTKSQTVYRKILGQTPGTR